MARHPPHDHGIEHEPHLSGEPFTPDPSEARVDQALRSDHRDAEVDQNVWDEPALSTPLTGEPEAEQTYAGYLCRARDEMTLHQSWWWAITLALWAGPFAVLGALMRTGSESAWALMLIVIFAPAVEEMMKVALPTWAVEKRPAWYTSRRQIVLCGAVSGLVFAAIENAMYLLVYIEDPSPGIVLWRWTVCVALHTTCSIIASIGVARIWADTWRRMARPRLSKGFPWLLAAVILHGAYNGFATLFQLSFDQF